MDIATSLKWGGEIYYADDPRIDYHTYLKKSLRCPDCGECVHHRAGEQNKPYFAHMQKKLNSPECEYRVDGNNQLWSAFTLEGKGQRRKLFEQDFIRIVASADSSFYENIQTLKDSLDSETLKNFRESCFHYFYDNAKALESQCKSLGENKSKLKPKKFLQHLIVGEAINFLAVSSSCELLEKIIDYCIFKTHGSNRDLCNPVEVCEKLIEFLFSVQWNTSFSELENYSKVNTESSNHRNRRNRQQTPNFKSITSEIQREHLKEIKTIRIKCKKIEEKIKDFFIIEDELR